MAVLVELGLVWCVAGYVDVDQLMTSRGQRIDKYFSRLIT